MPQGNVRVVGSGNTLLRVNQQPVAFLMSVGDTAPTPVAGAEAIQGIDDRHPREIITADAVGPGTLSLTLVETWNEEVWQRLITEFRDAADILDVYQAQRNMSNPITCEKLVKMPGGSIRGRVYHGCVITNISEDETIAVGEMSKQSTITVMYTHWTPM